MKANKTGEKARYQINSRNVYSFYLIRMYHFLLTFESAEENFCNGHLQFRQWGKSEGEKRYSNRFGSKELYLSLN